MVIPSENIGSLPRSNQVIQAYSDFQSRIIDKSALNQLLEKEAISNIAQLEKLGSKIVTDGEVFKPSFVTYAVAGMDLDPNGAVIPFEDGHTRQLPAIKNRGFKYSNYASEHLSLIQGHATVPVKVCVISPSAISLMYPAKEISGYPRDLFIDDLLKECETDIRNCLEVGVETVQIDATELRLSIKLDPSLQLLRQFVELINKVLDRFSYNERSRIGLHTCPGGDQDSCHSLDVEYSQLIPELFNIKAGKFYIALKCEQDQDRVLQLVREHLPEFPKVFFGVTDVCDPRVETPEEIKDLVLKIAQYIPPDRFGTCDDCGFSPFSDDRSTSIDTALAKIKARIDGTRMAENILGI